MLTAVTLVLRAVGVSFNIYIANIIGASGMGLFSLIMSVYNFGITFACSGINLASTKIVSEELALNSHGGIKQAVKITILYAFIFGGCAFLFIFFGANYIGGVFLNDARTILSLKILSVSLPCVSISAAISGYFVAVGRVYKNAIVQLLEQFIRVAACVFMLSFFVTENSAEAYKYVVLSGSIAEVLSFLLIIILLYFDITRYSHKKKGENILKRILSVSIPIAISSYVRSALSTVEHTMIPKGLKKHGGGNEEALSSYGVIHGMVMPLIFFPSSILQSFSSLLIPEVTMQNKKGETKKIGALIEKSLSVTLAFSIGASGIFFFFSEEIGLSIYKNTEAVHFLKMVSPLVAIMYFDEVVDAILKGLNQQVYSMGYNIVDSALAILLMFYLLPLKGIGGYIIILYITEMVNAFLSINRLIKVSDFRIHPIKWTFVPGMAILSSVYFIKSFNAYSLGNIHLIISLLSAALIYFFIMYLFLSDKYKSLVAKHFFI